VICATLAYLQRVSRYKGQLIAKRIEREYLVDVPTPEAA